MIVMGASTHEGEEEMILKACSAAGTSRDDLLLILAPRHPHRSDEVAKLVAESGLELIRHSTGDQCGQDTKVFLLDTLGELTYFYGVADIAIVGGSLVPVGGHNLLEAVAAGAPVIMGPHLDNIEDIANMFKEAGGLLVAANQQQLEDELSSLVTSELKRLELAVNATRVLEANKGALDKVQEIILGSVQ
jgi:3-deoxy-D-manno-octulosonic-acid transferase